MLSLLRCKHETLVLDYGQLIAKKGQIPLKGQCEVQNTRCIRFINNMTEKAGQAPLDLIIQNEIML